MKNLNIFCFGFGQVAKSFINKLESENFNINLSSTSRKKTHSKKFNNINYTSFFFDGEKFDFKLIEELKKADHILVSIPPRNGTDLVIKNFYKIIENCNAKWITYLSATSVYGDHKGKWVNEESETKPLSPNGIDRLISERLWLSLYLDKKLPIQVFRLSGIYSIENNILIRLKLGTAKIVNKKNHFFSRIHVEDIANILFLSLSKFKPGEIYNISDDKPSLPEDIILYGIKILNMEKPEVIEVKDIKSEMLKNFYQDSKKVSNKKIKIFFNYSFKFPTYVEGLNYIQDKLIKF